jgi:adenylate cyclase
MAVEIERKFLLRDDRWRASVRRSERMLQGYVANNDRCAVRVRMEGDKARLNIKSAGLDIQRMEYEYDIPCSDASEIIESLCGNEVVAKTRHYVDYGHHVYEIDEFEGGNTGLLVAEVELASRDEAFERPEWLGKEVSGDPRYLNSNLARHPFCHWG